MIRKDLKGVLPKNYIMVTLLLCLCFIGCSFLLIKYMMIRDEADNLLFLRNAAAQNVTAIEKQIEGDLTTLNTLSLSISNFSDPDPRSVSSFLKKVNRTNSFKYMGYAGLDGSLNLLDTHSSRHWVIDISGQTFFTESISGNQYITDSVTDPQDPEDSVYYYSVPVKDQTGNITGMLCAANSSKELQDIIEGPLFQNNGYSGVMDRDGNFIILSNRLNLSSHPKSDIKDLGVVSDQDKKKISAALSAREPVDFTVHADTGDYLAVFEPIKANDWYSLSLISKNMLKKNYSQTILGIAVINLVACSIFFFLLYQQRYIMMKSQEELSHLAYDDEITGCRNYRKFLLDAKELLINKSSSQYAFWYCDIKNFKYFNDVYGYKEGDKLLCRLSRIFEGPSGDGFIFCRISADNFAGIRPFHNKAELEEWFFTLLDKIVDQGKEQFHNLCTEISMGFYCINPADGPLTVNDMVNRANMAQKSIKSHPGSQCAFFSNITRDRFLLETEIEAMGREALKNNEFKLFLQPKIDIQNGNKIAGAEVLARWFHPEKGLISPEIFIPVFEKNDMVVDLDRYMFDKVCSWLREYLDQGRPPISIAVNVSRLGLLRKDFISYYSGVKDKYCIPDQLLELELTESVMLDDESIFLDKVCRLQEMGFICSLDDFGSGYSSLNLLKNLPINILKLDILFFRQSVSIEREQIVISNIINMARQLKIRTIAEGVESIDNVNFLRQSGCDYIQGYVFAKPMPLEDFDRLLADMGGAPFIPRNC